MKVFDASSIYAAIKTGKSGILNNAYSVILARYELGNVIWKETALAGLYSIHEGADLSTIFDHVLEGMKLLHPSLKQVYSIAIKYKISYYDASYLFAAMDLKLPLVTEDIKLRRKVGGALQIYSLAEIV